MPKENIETVHEEVIAAMATAVQHDDLPAFEELVRSMPVDVDFWDLALFFNDIVQERLVDFMTVLIATSYIFEDINALCTAIWLESEDEEEGGNPEFIMSKMLFAAMYRHLNDIQKADIKLFALDCVKHRKDNPAYIAFLNELLPYVN